DYLHSKNRSQFMLELLVPPEKTQLQELQGDKKAYDMELRPRLMVEAIEQLQDAQVEPDVWKIEGLDRREDCAKVVVAARRDGPAGAGSIIGGRGRDEKRVREWWMRAGGVRGFIGLGVGRKFCWAPLVNGRPNKIAGDAAATKTPRRYREFVDIFENAR